MIPSNDRTLQDHGYKAIGSGGHVMEQEMYTSLQPFQILTKAFEDPYLQRSFHT